MELHLKLIGGLLILLAMAHIAFPRYFNWKEDMAGITMINRQMMYIHTFFIGLVVLLIGILCLTLTDELLNTRLGKYILFGLFIFWGCRLLIQFIGYSSKLWKGKRLETLMHILFSITWTYLTIVFLITYWLHPVKGF
jgi:hypothetical protein